MLEGSRSIVNRRLLCVSRIEHTIECSNYTLLAKGRASEFYTIFDNETSLPPSETPSPRPGIAIDVRIQSMAIMSSPFLGFEPLKDPVEIENNATPTPAPILSKGINGERTVRYPTEVPSDMTIPIPILSSKASCRFPQSIGKEHSIV